ncbi:hypothetical protein [Mesorhizobium sp. B2-1-3A]|uniref:hypothetical protein n=1 Tax=Mesorhizobium sp. B2-1-3A TaxID=2589971 RepID=UPI0015E3FA12|nr:hypothetical protein [Mesorhizobium sp. B2-1-3A]
MSLEDAIIFSVDNMDTHPGKQPWIKAGEAIFAPHDIAREYVPIMTRRAAQYGRREI